MYKNTGKVHNLKRHKAKIIPDRTYKIENKPFVTTHPRNAYMVEFPDHIWIPFIDQPQ